MKPVHLFSMAFYTVRVNEDGKEMESPRTPTPAISYRNFQKNADTISQITDRTLQTETTGEKNDIPINNYKTVRYVNSAAFIEKDIKSIQPEPINSERSTYDSNSNDEDIADQQYQSHIIMDNDVPLLELNSNESFPSTNTMCYSYRKVCEVTKIIQKPDAYREWLDAKKIAKSFEQQRKQNELKKVELEKEERKKLALDKFNKWTAKKLKEKLAKDKKKLDEKKQKAELEEKEKKILKMKSEDEKKRKESNFNAWLKQKMEQGKNIKEKQLQEIIIAKECENRRKQDSQAIYDEWMKTVDLKPKPVPLNRGLFTLKGTISKIYINKNQWVPTDEYIANTRTL